MAAKMTKVEVKTSQMIEVNVDLLAGLIKTQTAALDQMRKGVITTDALDQAIGAAAQFADLLDRVAPDEF